ncbi:unnamed protein product [Ilex paraguariensis]|uniref:Pentatricopeptide repeat-containing protein n=1 Tax=Ilex paraguariensis TaxID=185542 RepID=A0ABC8SY65_9AQUA
MARSPPSFTNLILRRPTPRTLQNPNSQIRNIGASNDGTEFNQQNQDPINSNRYDNQNFIEIAREVSKIIRTRPRWEQTILSDFPTINFGDPHFFREVLMHQKNVFLSLRFFNWVSSQNGVLPDSLLCNEIFTGLVEAKAANAARNFLDSTKFGPEPACLEAYIQCLCGNGLIEEANDVFDQLKRMGKWPSLVTWNSALLGAIRARRTDLVWKLYVDMIECGVIVDVDTIGYLIQAFCIEEKFIKGHELLRQVLEDGHVPSKVSFNRLMSGFCKDRCYNKVSILLHTMIAKNHAPDIYTYQEIIHGLCKRKMRHEGFRIFNDLKDRGYVPDRVMYTTMINGLCKMKWLGDARKLWFEMIQKGIIPSEYTYNALIYGFCKTGQFNEVRKLYKEMCDRGYSKTTVSYNTMISGLCLHGRVEEAHALFKQMDENGITRDSITYNSLVQGFCKEGKIVEGTKYLYELLEQGLQPTTSSCTVLIEKLCQLGHMDEAKTLWKDMQDRGVKPVACNNDSILIGLSEQGYVAEGIEWLATMLKSRLKPQKETFERLVQVLSQGDKLDDALLVLGYMFKIGYALSECVCHSLVNRLCKDNSHHVETCIGDILQNG